MDYRPAVELGLIGLGIWLFFLYKAYSKSKRNERVLILQSILFPLMFCHETFMSNYYWLILYLINTRIDDMRKNT